MKRRAPPVAATDAPHTPDDAAAATRRAAIDKSAATLGRAWAEHCRRELHGEGRAASGGWPGTMREARSRVGRTLVLLEDGHNVTFVITEAERDLAAHTAYCSARDEWRKRADPEP